MRWKRAQAKGLFRADHLLHLRCEICDPETPALVDATIGRDIARLVSVMDHTPGDRQSVDIDKWFAHMIHEMEIDAEEGRARMQELLDRSARVGAEVRAHVVVAAHAHALPLMSHDDRTEAQPTRRRPKGVSDLGISHHAGRRRAGRAITARPSSPARPTCCAAGRNRAMSRCARCWRRGWSTCWPPTTSRAARSTPPSPSPPTPPCPAVAGHHRHDQPTGPRN